MKKLNKIALGKINVDEDNILRKKELKSMMGGYSEGDPGTCTACDDVCHCVTLPCPYPASPTECMEWIKVFLPAPSHTCS